MKFKNFFDDIKYNIDKCDNIVILCHINPDHDSVGSTTAFKNILSNNFDKKVNIISEITPFYCEFSYNDSKNAIINDNTLIFSLDCANVERLSYDYTLLSKNTIIKIDHHPNNAPYGNINIVDEKYSSTCEMIWDLSKTFNWEVSTKDSELIFLGIIGDTGRFLFKNTTSNTFKCAKEIIENGANPIKNIYPKIYKKSLTEIHLKSLLIKELNVDGNFGYLILDEKYMKLHGISKNNISKMTN